MAIGALRSGSAVHALCPVKACLPTCTVASLVLADMDAYKVVFLLIVKALLRHDHIAM